MGGVTGLIQGLSGVIGPSLPKRKTLLTLVIGIIIGLLWAYLIGPVVFYNADPSTLQQDFQDEWVKLLADRQAAANADVSDNIASLLLYVDDPLGIVQRLINDPAEAENRSKLEAIVSAAERAQPSAATAPQPSFISDILPFILAPLIVVILAGILSVVWNLLIYPFAEPTINRLGLGKRATGPGAVSNEQAAKEIQAIKDAKKAMAENKVDYTATLGTPLIQKMSIYALGRGQYDDSFSIEDADDRFLGECGAGISETIGVGEPTKATAVEVWLFDKDDFVRTVTKIFASPHAFNDPALRSKLEAKGDIVLAEPGAVAVLETSSLRLQARIVDVDYGTGPLPPNSYFEKMTIEVAAWRKEPGAAPVQSSPVMAPAPVYAPPAAAPVASPSFAPSAPTMPMTPVAPPASPSPFGPPPPRPTTFGGQPPPAAPTPRRTDDDPFGGTGDFTPIS